MGTQALSILHKLEIRLIENGARSELTNPALDISFKVPQGFTQHLHRFALSFESHSDWANL